MNIDRFAILIIVIESLLGMGFFFFTPSSIKPEGTKVDYTSLWKGVLERFFLMISLINNYPHALTLFSALKLGPD